MTSKKDIERIRQLHPIARRYEVAAYKAKAFYANTGEAMYQPGALTELKRKAKAAQAEIDQIQGRKSIW